MHSWVTNPPKSRKQSAFHKVYDFNHLRVCCTGRGHIGSCLALKADAWLLDSFA